jgi:hypothetical protein
MQKEFSFSINKQGVIIEILYNLIEKEFYIFLVDNKSIIPPRP